MDFVPPARIVNRIRRSPVGAEKSQIIVHCVGNGVTAGTACFARTARRALCLGEIENALAVRFLIIVGEHERPVCGAQIVDPITTLPVITPRNPGAGAAGELSVADMQSLLDESEIRLMARLKTTAGGSGFEVRVANLARHRKAPAVLGSNTGPIYGGRQPKTTMHRYTQFCWINRRFLIHLCTPMHPFVSLSRRKHGFDSRRARQRFQWVSPHNFARSRFLGNFWGVNVAER